MCWLVEIRNSVILLKQHTHVKGPGGGGQVVSMLVFYTNDPSLNPAEAYNFYYAKNCLKERKNKKETGKGHFYFDIPVLFFFIFVFSIHLTVCSIKKFAIYWIRTSDLRCWKRPL